MTNQTSHQRRPRSEWQAIIESFSRSGLSGAQFCKTQDIQYAAFCKWRQQLLPQAKPAPSFIDLTTLPTDSCDTRWRITLKLGNGVELLLNQA